MSDLHDVKVGDTLIVVTGRGRHLGAYIVTVHSVSEKQFRTQREGHFRTYRWNKRTGFSFGETWSHFSEVVQLPSPHLFALIARRSKENDALTMMQDGVDCVSISKWSDEKLAAVHGALNLPDDYVTAPPTLVSHDCAVCGETDANRAVRYSNENDRYECTSCSA